MDFVALIQLLDSALRLSTPLLLACLAGLFSERAGIFDIGLEGKMLAAAFSAGAVSAVSGSALIGLSAGIGVSVLLALLHGLMARGKRTTEAARLATLLERTLTSMTRMLDSLLDVNRIRSGTAQ